MANPAAPGQPAEHPDAHATVEQPTGAPAAEHEGGLISPPFFIALAMITVLAIIIWKKVPAAIGKALDQKIEGIRSQLAEAESLRKDAEALKAEYLAKTKSADSEAASIIERARHEADGIVTQAKANADALIERRQRMAEDKIAAEERAALDQLRATVAEAARGAATTLIRERIDANADDALIGEAIKGIGSR